jgi:hypothetical protein
MRERAIDAVMFDLGGVLVRIRVRGRWGRAHAAIARAKDACRAEYSP